MYAGSVRSTNVQVEIAFFVAEKVSFRHSDMHNNSFQMICLKKTRK